MWPQVLASTAQPVYETVDASITRTEGCFTSKCHCLPQLAACCLNPRDLAGLCGTGSDGEEKKG